MKIQDIIKKAVQNEFHCKKCDFTNECWFCDGTEKSESFNCSADAYERGFKNGFQAPVKEVLELIKGNPALIQGCMSTLSKHFAMVSTNIGASMLAIKESYKIKAKSYDTTFIMMTEEENGDGITRRANLLAESRCRHEFPDCPEYISKKIQRMLAEAIVLGYSIRDKEKDEELNEEEE